MNKSQVSITETVAILFIFFILVIMGLVFYARMQRSSIEAQYEKGTDLMAIEVAQKASFLPELQCSKKNIVTDNCIDILKLESAEKIINGEKKEDYSDLFFNSEIVVQEIYPKKKIKKIYSNPVEGVSSIFTAVPILLYNATGDEYYFGVLNVTYFAVK